MIDEQNKTSVRQVVGCLVVVGVFLVALAAVAALSAYLAGFKL